jgi:chemotaxis protein methyltransferase CheR
LNPADPITSRIWLSPLSEFVRERLGLHIPESHWKDLCGNFLKAADAFGYSDPAVCLQWLMQTELPPNELYKLAGFLTIGETYFFREKNHFEPMARHLFEEVIHRKRQHGNKQLRIWSAACSTGEEPYSIAMLLDSMLPDIHEWSVRILATDINPDFLARAQVAIYRPWSFRGTPEWVKQRYFQIENENHTVREDIRRRVAFDFLNLADDVYPSLVTQTQAMDVIFCRNVLIYFAPEQARKVIGRLQRSLVEGGWLVLSPTETIYADDPSLQREYIAESILYRKNSSPSTARRKQPEYFPRFSPPRNLPATYEPQPIPPPASAPQPAPASAKHAEPPPAPQKSAEYTIVQQAEAFYTQGLHRETAELIKSRLNGRAARNHEAFLLARAQANLGELDEALHNALNAVETGKLQPAYHYLLAMIQLEKDAHQEAARSLQRVLYLDDQHVMAIFSLGHLALQQQKRSVAEKYFKHALLLLKPFGEDAPVPEGEGMTAGRLRELIQAGLSDKKERI